MRRPTPPEPPDPSQPRWITRPELVFSLGLFTAAVMLLAVSLPDAAPAPPAALASFFVLFGVFSIRMGYQHPGLGYVSFDRIAQVSSLLVLGPVHAAWINGLASLLFPWLRLREGQPLPRVVVAALNNAGLMALMVFACGSLYAALGGPVPLLTLDGRTLGLLALLVVSMQGLNELMLRVHLRLREGAWPSGPSLFAYGMEGGAALAGILVAVVITRTELPVVALLLTVLCAGMLMLRQFARMRIHLESLVAERTRVLHQKTLELEELAIRDQLTGLLNRRFAEAYMGRRIEEYQRYHRRFTVAMVDLDNFKRINDELSHGVGDQVLERVARIFEARCRESDMVARWGGEEFLLCFDEADAPRALQICEALRREVISADWSGVAPGLRVSLSAGVAEMEAGLGFGQLLQVADRKLYQAKNAGRNLVMA